MKQIRNIQKGAVMVTGTSSGIGRCIVDQLGEAGYHVFAGVRKEEDAKRLSAEAKGRVTPLMLDITRPDHIENAVASVTGTLEPNEGIAGLINNAGSGIGGPMEFIGIDDLRRQLEINTVAQIALTQAFLPLIRKARGRIINIGSVAGRMAVPFSGPYSASKAALKILSDALRRELLPWNIHVVFIEVGAVNTSLTPKALDDLENRAKLFPEKALKLYEMTMRTMKNYMNKQNERGITPENAAKVVVKAMRARKPKTRYFVGPAAYVGLFISMLPDRLVDMILQREQRTS